MAKYTAKLVQRLIRGPLALAFALARMLLRAPSLRAFASREYTDLLASRTKPRPHPFSLWSHVARPSRLDLEGPVNDYTSWPSLTDRKFSARHLPPCTEAEQAALPDLNRLQELFRRPCVSKCDGPDPEEQMIPCRRSSALFMFFAQWFTDSILRIDPTDRRRNTSNHDIDLCQIYGADVETTNLLREHAGGRLSIRWVNGCEYLDNLFERDEAQQWKLRRKYEKLPYIPILDKILEGFPPDRRWTMYATGLERGNSSIGYVAVSTLFVREHNRICGLLSREYGWSDDERLFQTARNINIVVLIKLLLEDYINHILGYPLFLFDPSFAERRHWYRQNWIALEFNLLYRWHGLVPGSMTLGGQSYDHWQFRNNNAFFEQQGLRKVVEAVSLQRAGRIGLGNTPKFLLPADSASLRMSRAFRLKPFNDYRERFGLRRLRSFEQLTTDKDLRATLTRLYPKGIDQLELIPGLFAESPQGNALFGKLMIAMVGYDALTQIYSNPLISEAVFTPETFTPRGMDVIRETTSIQSLVERNLSEAEKDGRGRVVASLSLR